jgi:hypothetical protein
VAKLLLSPDRAAASAAAFFTELLAEASLAMPTWRAGGLCPAARLNPGGKRLRFRFFASDGRGIACDADMEGGRALPGRPIKPRWKAAGFGFFDSNGE